MLFSSLFAPWLSLEKYLVLILNNCSRPFLFFAKRSMFELLISFWLRSISIPHKGLMPFSIAYL